MKVFRTAALAVVAAMGLALVHGETARADEPARSGKTLKIRITWKDKTDVDLHVTQPDGVVVNYGNKTPRNGGHLIADANANPDPDKGTNTPEEVYEFSNALSGQYVIEVKMFGRHGLGGTTPVIVEIFEDGRPVFSNSDSPTTLRGPDDFGRFFQTVR